MRKRRDSYYKMSQNQDMQAKNLYESGLSMSQVAKEMNQPWHRIQCSLHRFGALIRDYATAGQILAPSNSYCFDKIDEASAYWIGFLMADGCIALAKRTPRVELSLAVKDIDHVKKFKSFVGTDNAITITQSGDSARIRFANKHIVEVLSNYGVCSRKSTREKVIGLENNKHFWRGVIDGDGSVLVYGNVIFLRLCGSLDLLTQFKNFVLGLCPRYIGNVKKVTNAQLHGMALQREQAVTIIKELYADCIVALDRKKKVADYIIEHSSELINRKRARLSKANLIEIAKIGYSEPGNDVAKRFGTSPTHISRIRNRIKNKLILDQCQLLT